jgi:hypothetical protein
MNSLLGQTELPVPATREGARNSLELLRELKSASAETAGFWRFPCYFRCSQGKPGRAFDPATAPEPT